MEDLKKYSLTCFLDENIKMIKEIFKNDESINMRIFQNQYSGLRGCLFFISDMVDTKVINEHILKPILESKVLLDDVDLISYLSNEIITSSTLKCSTSIDELVNAIVSGDTVLILEGYQEVIINSTKGWKVRAIEEPNSEKVLRGPKEGFIESMSTNLSMIRRKVCSKDLKFISMTLGERTRTKVCICYIDGLVHEDILNNIIKKIENISIDGITDVKYIGEFIDENPFSLFETSFTSEKPDTISGKILEGRVAVLVDGSPSVMTLPSLFIESFMAGDDYYINYYYASLGRLLRILGFIASISIPALYLSLVSFHQGTLQTPLLITIYAARVGVPFPSIVELLILLTVFEILREAGSRAPSTMGQAISIVGVLVLGTAAVDARLVSAPMIIIVGVSSITGLMIPNMTVTLSFIRAGLLLLSSVLGIYGYIFGMLALIIHLFSLRSCGIPFMGHLTSFHMQSIKDTIIRGPAWYMRYRPKFMSKDSKRGTIGGKGDE
ncbi:spore germination protein [Tissierella creatinophila]|uniref:Spore germination protein B1 n=1 Tax=Tissierella creatinophila DSM 6911 TaxID=1123403 RepID=A0A1U7M399_TISCR|nr:spore germination protein [Tissierella creatinophila]OLS01787.1 spore germination protein B1 [Tissierella creatinophila DSM 6911]